MSTARNSFRNLLLFRQGLRGLSELSKEYTKKEPDTTTEEELPEDLEVTGESPNEENIDTSGKEENSYFMGATEE